MTTPLPPDDLSRVNLRQLTQVYLSGTGAANASRLLGGEPHTAHRSAAWRLVRPFEGPLRLGHLLRDHDEEAVEEQWEVALRDDFDQLLSYYSLIEIACLVGYVSDDFDVAFRARALAELSEPHLRDYYEKHYPLVLPRLFRQRLEGTQHRRVAVPPDVARLYGVFLDVNALIEHDDNAETFLWFLDDGSWGGYDMGALLAALRTPDEFMERLSRPDVKLRPDRLNMAIDGFRTFLVFCRELHELLESCADYPELQSAFWHYHAYWFQRMKEKVGRRLGEALGAIAGWHDARSGAEDEARELAEMRQVLDQLMSGRYEHLLARLDDDEGQMVPA